jgi:hypothetical protein
MSGGILLYERGRDDSKPEIGNSMPFRSKE